MTNKLILGTVQMGLDYGVNNQTGKIPYEQVQLILREAYNSGIRFLDTAEAYGDAHKIIGDFHEANPNTIFQVITKIPATDPGINFDKKVRRYLEELKIPRLEALMFHSFSAYQKFRSQQTVLKQLKTEDLFNKLGVSIYTNDEFNALIQDDAVDLIQLPFNLLDNGSLRGELLEKAKKKGKIVHTRSVFLQGLFFKKPNDNNPIVKELKDQLTQIHKLANDSGASISDLALSYCLQQKNIDGVLIGIDSIEQLRSNLKSREHQPSQDTIDQIDRIQTKNTDLLNPALWN